MPIEEIAQTSRPHLFARCGARRALPSALIAIVVGGAACTERPQGSDSGPADAAVIQPLEVRVSTSIKALVRRQLPATGTLFADEETIVAAKVSGRIVELRVDLGDDAAVGSLLAQIDPVDAELALQERRLALAEALAQLGLDPTDHDQLLAIGEDHLDQLPAVQRTRRQADNSRSRLDRSEVLLDQDPPLISEQDHADLRTAWEVAEQDHQLSLLAARATLARARTLTAQVASAERVLADTSVLAPEGISPPLPPDLKAMGVDWDRQRHWSVAERYVGIGTFVQPGTALFRLVDSDPLKLRVAVPEHRIAEVALGAIADVRGEGAADPISSRVLRIGPAVDPRTRTFGVEIIVPNPARALRPGGFARASIHAAGLEEAVLVPADAVVAFAGIEKLFVVDGAVAAERRVEIGSIFDGLVEIVRGLDAGATVIRRPPNTLLPGTPVRIVEQLAITPPSSERGG